MSVLASVHLDVQRLRTFREVARRRSFSAAADALDYTQSAVSQQVSKLERDVGLVLVDRVRRPIELTEAGRVLLARSDRIFGELTAAASELERLAGLESGTLRIGGFATACATVMPLAIRRFAAQHANVTVQLSEMEPGFARQRVRAAELDLAVTYRLDAGDAMADDDDDDGFRSVVVARDPFVVALPVDHQLAGRAAVELAELRDDRWVAAPASGAGRHYRQYLVSLCQDAGFDPEIAFEPGDLWTGRGIVAAGLAVALMPQLAFTVPSPGVVVRPLAGASPARSIVASYMESRRVPSVAPFVDALVATFGREGAAGVRP